MHGQRDIDRSSWWKSPEDQTSSIKRMQHWIKINDIRYGVDSKNQQVKYSLQAARQALEAQSIDNFQLARISDHAETEMALITNRSLERSIRVDSEVSQKDLSHISVKVSVNQTVNDSLAESEEVLMESARSGKGQSDQARATQQLVSQILAPPILWNKIGGDVTNLLPLRDLNH